MRFGVVVLGLSLTACGSSEPALAFPTGNEDSPADSRPDDEEGSRPDDEDDRRTTGPDDRTDAGGTTEAPSASGPSDGGTETSPALTTTTEGEPNVPGPPRVLLFSRTAGFRHDSIPTAVAALQSLGLSRGWTVEATEDPTWFSAQTLARFDVAVWLMTTGDVLDANQQAAFEAFVRAGGGYVGVHSATDTEYDWPWYGALVGAYFLGHPPGTPRANLVVERKDHPSTEMLPSVWTRTDEWYSFQANPRANVEVLVSIDEQTYGVAELAMGDHPMAWFHEYEGGRAFYTALGHTNESYVEPEYLAHIAGAVEWAAATN